MKVIEMLSAYENAQLVYVAAKLGIADMLAEGPRFSDELALASKVNADALRRVMRGLVNRGLLTEESPGCFGLSSEGEALKSSAEGDLRGIAINIGELLYATWGSLFYSLKTGKPAFEHIFGMSWFDYLKKYPEHGRIFDRGMTNDTRHLAKALLKAYDFSDIHLLADIGGGQGILLKELLAQYHEMEGILFDAYEVIAQAAEQERCKPVGGDFFEGLPIGCDAYILKSIIHDWNDEQALQILKNCRSAMKECSRLILIEPILPERIEEFSVAVEMDLGMLLLLNGRERTLKEFDELYTKAGFKLTKTVSIAEPFFVIEGKPI